jgi:hypothetical protein
MQQTQMINGIPMAMALHLMSKYIRELKGVSIHPKAPQTPEEIELFEKMIGYVFNYYNVTL